jgi:hypothetical protein
MRRVGDGELFGAFPFLIKLSADGGDQGSEFRSAMSRFWRASMSSQSHRLRRAAQTPDRRTHLDGSVDVDEWPRSGNALSHKALAFPGSPTVIPCCENDVITQDVLGQILWKMGRSDNCDIKLTWLGINTVL